jgi:hypothetical protein
LHPTHCSLLMGLEWGLQNAMPVRSPHFRGLTPWYQGPLPPLGSVFSSLKGHTSAHSPLRLLCLCLNPALSPHPESSQPPFDTRLPSAFLTSLQTGRYQLCPSCPSKPSQGS